MHIYLLEIEFQLPGSRSLKEKRQRLAGVKDKVGRQPSVAVIEAAKQDVPDQAVWALTLMAGGRSGIDQLLAGVEEQLLLIDGYISQRQLQQL